MQTYSQTLVGGVAWRLIVPGQFVRVLTASAVLDLRLLGKGYNPIDEFIGLQAGLAVHAAQEFLGLEITSATAQAIKIVAGYGDVDYDRAVGDVNATEVLGTTIADSSISTIGTSATAVLAANSSRRSARFYNPGALDIVIGSASVTTNGAVIIKPGMLWVENDAPGAAWYAISSAASQTLRIQELT